MSIDFDRWFLSTASPFAAGPPQDLSSPRASVPAWVPPPARPRTIEWTLERIAGLSSPEVRQLLANATRLEDTGIAARCAEVLKDRPDQGGGGAAAPASAERKGLRLVSRDTAFGLRGASLTNRFWSRSGVTRAGDIIFALWAADARREGGGTSYLLWAPNVDGSRPWSDKPAGRERLEHCQRALKRGAAFGLLVYGERIPGVLPDDKAARIDGVDAGLLMHLTLEMRGAQYWALSRRGYG